MKRLTRSAPLAILLLAAILVTAACTGGSSSPAPSPAGDQTLTRGGTLRVGILNNDVDIWDPQEAPSAHAMFELSRCCLFRTLLSYRAGTTQQEGTVLRPDLASALPEISSDGLAWTFHLQEGLHYAPPLQDVEITAPDFIRSLERLLDPTMVGYGWPYFPGLIAPLIDGGQAYADGEATTIAGLEVLDPYTLRIRLSEPNGDLGYLMATWMVPPIPPNPQDPGARFGIADGHRANFSGFMVASGPYMLEGGEDIDFSLPPVEQVPASGVRGDAVTLVRNPSWDPATDPLRPAYVDRIVLSRISRPDLPDDDKADRIAEARGRRAVEAGDLDVLLDVGVPRDMFERFRSDPMLRPRLAFAESDALHYIGMNVAQPPFDDVHVRRAFNLAIDKSALIDANGEDEPLAPQGHIGFNSQEANLLVNYDLAPTPGGKGDPTAARAEMARSRYDRDGDGRCDGSVCQGALAVSNPNFAGTELIVEALSEIGIQVDLEANDTFYATYQDPSAHAALRIFDGWVKDYPSAATMFPQLFEGANAGRCCNDLMVGASASQLRGWGYPARAAPTVDARIEQCKALLFTAAARCWADLDQTLSEQVVPWVPLWSGVTGRIVSRRVASMALDQAAPEPQPALDRIALTPEAATEAPPASPPASEAAPTGAASSLDGTYTLTASSAEVDAAGLEECDAQQALGTYTLTMSRGRWQLSQVIDVAESVWARYTEAFCPNPYPNLYFPGWAGGYRVDGSSLRLRSDDQPLRPGLAWRMRADRGAAGLSLTVIDGPQRWWSTAGFFYRPGTFPWESGDWVPSG